MGPFSSQLCYFNGGVFTNLQQHLRFFDGWKKQIRPHKEGIQPKGWKYSKSNDDFDLVDGWAPIEK